MVVSFPLWPDKIVHLSSCSLSIYLSRASPHYCRESAWNRVAREAYLVSRKQGYPARKRSFRRALHASRDTSDEERSSGSAIAAEVLVNSAD